MPDREPGPWYALPWWKKAFLWLRYQPAYKLGALIEWARYTALWFAKYRQYPTDPEFAPDRVSPSDGDGVVYVCPSIMWKITVAQDARQLGSHWILRFPSTAVGEATDAQ
jgi:hypothetical protein